VWSEFGDAPGHARRRVPGARERGGGRHGERRPGRARPRELVRGLIHSDGRRSVNRFKTKLPSGRVAEYAYVRYFFSNLSEDIKDVFCHHCDLLGVRWSRASRRYVSVHDRRSVALLDGFVGPKR
jgi:hypothetical protein